MSALALLQYTEPKPHVSLFDATLPLHLRSCASGPVCDMGLGRQINSPIERVGSVPRPWHKEINVTPTSLWPELPIGPFPCGMFPYSIKKLLKTPENLQQG